MTPAVLDLGGITLPLDAITQTFGVLAVRGAGKSNTAAAMAEEMATHQLPFVVIDPVGSWYGLRSAADGKGPGLPIPIFGGEHGDIPLERTAGALIADLIVDQRLSAILDVSTFSKGERIKFLTDFAEQLYKRNRDPLHLFLEEADDFIPQKPFREEARCLAAWETIVRRGRGRGLGITMITQRSASINKNVLTQVETLIVLRITAPQDRKAIAAWVEYHGQAKELLESLSGLQAGEAWVWSPQWLGTTTRVQMRRRRTFDSGATPKNVRGRRPAATLADVDLPAVTAAMAATIERVKADDPKVLRSQLKAAQASITKLETDLAAARAATPAPIEVEKIVTVVSPETLAQLEALWKDIKATLEAKHVVWPDQSLHGPGARPAVPVPAKPTAVTTRRIPPASKPAPRTHIDVPERTGPEQRILDAIAWLESIGNPAPEQAAVAFVAGYTIGGGAFNNPRGALRSKGLILYEGDRLRLTENGRACAEIPDETLTSEELQRRVLERLPGPEQRILRPLIDAYPNSMSQEDLAEASGYQVGGGAFNNPRGRLRTLGLIDYTSDRRVVARDVLFVGI